MNLLRRKSVTELQTEALTDHSLKRALGALNLTMLGIGAIIGTGIFVLTGTVAAVNSGPAVVLSFVIAGVASVFAALCYSEFASLVPMAGSAYTYGYATLGELVAWIIGWDLVLEYALGAVTVAIGWSGYVVSFLKDIGITVPPALSAARGTVVTLADGSTITAVFNLPAVSIIAIITTLLVIGIKESANVNNVIVFVKVAVVLLFIGGAAHAINPANWHPFIPPPEGPGLYGWSGVMTGAAIVFFAYIGFDAVSTAAQEAKNPQKDMPVGIIGSLLICTVLYILVSGIGVAFVSALLTVREAGSLVSIGTLLAFVIVSIGVLVLRIREPNLPRAFKTPWVWFVAPAGALSALYLMASLPWRTWERLIIWFVFGMAIYSVYGVWNSKLASRK